MLTIEKVKKIHPKKLLKLIDRAKKFLKNHHIIKDMCKEWGLDVDVIDLIPVKFGELEVSARTDHGVITLNYKLLCDGDFFKDYMYLCHEIEHYFQQCFGDKPTRGADDGNYLDNPYEQKAFQRQVQYVDDMFGEEEVERYLNHLLNHHDINGKEKEEKKDILMEKIDE